MTTADEQDDARRDEPGPPLDFWPRLLRALDDSLGFRPWSRGEAHRLLAEAEPVPLRERQIERTVETAVAGRRFLLPSRRWWRHRRDARGRSPALVACALLCLGAGFAVGAWDGRASASTLDYREAVEIVLDDDAPLERRKSALGRIYRLTEYGGEAMHHAIGFGPDSLRDDALDYRDRIVQQWSR